MNDLIPDTLMKLNRHFFLRIATASFFRRRVKPFAPPAATPPSTPPPTTPPVYVPDYSHANDPLPDGVLAWDGLTKATDAAADQSQAHFTFNFTNVSSGNVALLNVHPSCGCTTAQLPPLPWIIRTRH